MPHKLTPEALFADFARTMAVAETNGVTLDWNEETRN